MYEILRKWRATLCKEQNIVAYKIFKNRSIVGFVRRRRNDRKYAASGDSSKSEVPFEKICDDLLDCWGIGPTSIMEGGYAHQMLVSTSSILLYACSRNLCLQLHQYNAHQPTFMCKSIYSISIIDCTFRRYSNLTNVSRGF